VYWGVPEPLALGHCEVPFPGHALPVWAARYVAELAENTQTSPAFVGPLVLAVLSTACGGRLVVEAHDNWHEPVNLYVVSVLESGNRKSAVIAHLTRPVVACERYTTSQTGQASTRVLRCGSLGCCTWPTRRAPPRPSRSGVRTATRAVAQTLGSGSAMGAPDGAGDHFAVSRSAAAGLA
jgi:hypothetical protein